MVNPASDAIFVADFPGLTLENFLSEDLADVTLEVMQGQVVVLLASDAQADGLHSLSDDNFASCGRGSHVPCGGATDICNMAECCTTYPCPSHLQDHTINDHCILCDFTKKKYLNKERSTKNYERERNGERINQDLENKKKLKMPLSFCGVSGKNGKKEATKSSQSVVLEAGDKLVLPSGSFHSVVTTSPEPSSFMYTFTNTSLLKMYQALTEDPTQESSKITRTSKNMDFLMLHNTRDSVPQQQPDIQATSGRETKDIETPGWLNKFITGNEASDIDEGKLKRHMFPSQDSVSDFPAWQDFVNFMSWKWATFKRSGRLLVGACRSILSGTPMKLI